MTFLGEDFATETQRHREGKQRSVPQEGVVESSRSTNTKRDRCVSKTRRHPTTCLAPTRRWPCPKPSLTNHWRSPHGKLVARCGWDAYDRGRIQSVPCQTPPAPSRIQTDSSQTARHPSIPRPAPSLARPDPGFSPPDSGLADSNPCLNETDPI